MLGWALGMGFMLAVLIAAAGHPHEAYFDARVQLDGARDVLSGNSPYGVYYQSPLWSAFFLMPFAALAEPSRYVAWFWANVVAWGAACLLLATVARIPGGWPGRVLAASLLTVYPPAVWSMHGQMDGFMGLGLAASLALWPAHPFIAGLALAVLAVKPHLAAFPIALLLLASLRSGQWRMAPGLVTGGVVLFALSVAVQPSWPGQWLNVVSHPPPDLVLARSKFTQTVSAFMGLWAPGWLAGAFGWAIAVAAFMATCRWVWVKKPPTPDVAAVGVGALFLVTPYAQGYDLSLLLVPMALVLGRSFGAPIVAGVSLLSVFAMAMAMFEWPQSVLVLSAPIVLGLWWLSRK